MESADVQHWLWIATNVLVGGPLALAVLVVLRESIRAAVALPLGFRVFEIQWGVGPRLLERPLGPIVFAIAPIPLAGATIACSGVAHRHRLARMLLALTPPLCQLLYLIGRSLSGIEPMASISSGPAPMAIFDLANATLLGLHLTFPIEHHTGIQTDLRLFVEAMLGRAGSSRAARASYYARLARLRLERSNVAAARVSLEQGLVQLGRESMLVDCQRRLNESDLASVIDQGDCADALRGIIQRAESSESPVPTSLGARVGRVAILSTPLVSLAIFVAASQAHRVASTIEALWQSGSEVVAREGDAERCGAYIETWTASARRLDRWFPPAPSTRSDRHLDLARLEYCRGDLEAASQHQGEGLLAANAARRELAQVIFSQPERWLENELRMTELFRNAAAVETERHAFRRALVAITNAEHRLETVRGQIGLWPEAEARGRAENTVAAQQAELVAMREQVMASLTGR